MSSRTLSLSLTLAALAIERADPLAQLGDRLQQVLALGLETADALLELVRLRLRHEVHRPHVVALAHQALEPGLRVSKLRQGLVGLDLRHLGHPVGRGAESLGHPRRYLIAAV